MLFGGISGLVPLATVAGLVMICAIQREFCAVSHLTTFPIAGIGRTMTKDDYPPFRKYYAINSSKFILRNDYASFAQSSVK